MRKHDRGADGAFSDDDGDKDGDVDDDDDDEDSSDDCFSDVMIWPDDGLYITLKMEREPKVAKSIMSASLLGMKSLEPMSACRLTKTK